MTNNWHSPPPIITVAGYTTRAGTWQGGVSLLCSRRVFLRLLLLRLRLRRDEVLHLLGADGHLVRVQPALQVLQGAEGKQRHSMKGERDRASQERVKNTSGNSPHRFLAPLHVLLVQRVRPVTMLLHVWRNEPNPSLCTDIQLQLRFLNTTVNLLLLVPKSGFTW